MEEMIKNPFDLFAELQETYQEAVKKSADESKTFTKIKHFAMNTNGTYRVRILPLAPIQQPDGSLVMDRKGYEYPIKTLFLKISNKSKNNKDNTLNIPIIHSSYGGLSVDLIDTYVKVAESMYGNNQKYESVLKKIKGSAFNNGLKWNSQRSMFVLDLDKRSEGIQLLSLTYSQYKGLEERKLNCWGKLAQKDPKAKCPISSIDNAYAVEITRSENGTVSYSFNIDILSGTVELEESEVKALLDAPRIPDVLYRYSRFHFEATIEYLKQYDESNGLAVMNSEEIKEAIEKINLELPADDKSHFSLDKNNGNKDDKNSKNELNLNSLWDRWEDLDARGISDKSSEGQMLRDDIRAFIDENELNVRVIRNKSNEDLLVEIQDSLKDGGSNEENEDDVEEEELPKTQQIVEEESEDVEENEDDEEPSERPSRGEHNDDTNEPALEAGSRRAARASRRRVR